MDAPYSKFAISLKQSKGKSDAHKIVDALLIGALEPFFPSLAKFTDGFVKFTFSKEKQVGNVKTRYALRKLNCVYSGNEIFEDDMSVEHIVPESASASSCNIGNLILLETKLNGIAGEKNYQDKKEIYGQSKSKWISSFVAENDCWDASKIDDRAKSMAKVYYERVFKKSVDTK